MNDRLLIRVVSLLFASSLIGLTSCSDNSTAPRNTLIIGGKHY